jgi:hypothetical protein
LELFPTGYGPARQRFRETVKQLPGVVQGQIPVPNQAGQDLTVDYAVLPATGQAKKMLVISGGVHGAEGPMGSAAQQLFLEEYLPQVDRSQTSVVLVHAYNPWGYEHNHRTAESNVDPNRNNLKDPEGFANYPVGDYQVMAETMSAQGPPPHTKWQSALGVAVGLGAAYFSLGRDLQRLIQGLAEGQNQDAKGVLYAGLEYLPQRQPLLEALKPHFEGVKQVYHFDVHTGLGKRGVLHMIDCTDAKDTQAAEQFVRPIEGQGIEFTSPSSPGFYDSTKGDFTNNIEFLADPDAQVLTFTAEVGTLGQGLAAQIGTVYRLKERNQLRFYENQVSPEKKAAILERTSELFNPPDPVWRDSSIAHFRRLFDHSLQVLNQA